MEHLTPLNDSDRDELEALVFELVKMTGEAEAIRSELMEIESRGKARHDRMLTIHERTTEITARLAEITGESLPQPVVH